MKTKLYCIIASIIIIVLSSCKENLTEVIYGTISDGTFWKTEKDISEGINSAYGGLNEQFIGFSYWQFAVEDCGSDICYSAGGGNSGPFFNYTGWSSTQPPTIDWGIYKFFWREISYLNKTLDMIPGAEMSDEKKLLYTSEARALRAIIYFMITQWFNDVPLVTSSKDLFYSIPQQPAAKIYEFIETELRDTYDKLPTRDQYIANGVKDYSRLTRGAVLGLLARTYLVQKKYMECANVCDTIINKQDENGTYWLMNDYPKIFTTPGYENTEVMWTLAGDGINNGMMLQIYLYKAWNNRLPEWDETYQSWSEDITLTTGFYNSFAATDQRRKCLYYDVASDANRVMLIKYPPITHDKILSATDFPVLRYADVLLMYAESLLLGSGDVAGAVHWVNEVRKRAGASEYNAGSFSAEQFKFILLEERKRELFFEGCGKRDMRRLEEQALVNLIKTRSLDAGDFPERYFYLPIPLSALTANPVLVQNPGYTN
jgi:hypothetical protein